jgi:hypothetical protein
MLKLPTGVGTRRLQRFREEALGHDLRAGAEDHAVGLWIAAVAGVPGRVDQVMAAFVVEDRGASVV